VSDPSRKRKSRGPGWIQGLTLPGLYLLVLAASGWLILIANLFGFAGRSGWIFPAVEDLPGLILSTLLLAIAGLTPMAIRQAFRAPGKSTR
jgi:hypothetical protein